MAAPPGPPPDLNTTPALEPPPGVKPNLEDAYTLRPMIIFCRMANIIVASIAILARLYTKGVVMKKTTHDDWMLVFAALANITIGVIEVIMTYHGIGAHQWDVSLADLFFSLKLLNYGEILFCLFMASTKYAVLKTIQRIFLTRQKRGYKWYLIQVLIWTNFAFYFAVIMAVAFSCDPPAAGWDPTIKASKCINRNALALAIPTVNTVSDALMLIVPFSGLNELNLPTRKKIGAGAVFAIAVFAVLNSAIRAGLIVPFIISKDGTWWLGIGFILANTESLLAVLCACLPVFPRMYKYVRTSPFVSSILGSSKQGSWGSSGMGSQSGNVNNAQTRSVPRNGDVEAAQQARRSRYGHNDEESEEEDKSSLGDGDSGVGGGKNDQRIYVQQQWDIVSKPNDSHPAS